MTDLQKMIRWLDLCPFIQTDLMHIDTTLAVPANAGLYPMGLKVLRHKPDVAGNHKAKCRYTFLLRCVLPEGETAAETVWKIQNWVFQQNMQGITPGLGQEESVWAEEGRLEKASQTGTSLYCMTLTVHYEQNFEGEE